jgi:hypothetical protein
MTTLRQAVQEYVRMRRDLGFKLREPGKALLDFVRFMKQHRASYITQALALHLGATAITCATRALGATPELRPRICPVSQRHRSPHGNSGAGPLAVPAEARAPLFLLGS